MGAPVRFKTSARLITSRLLLRPRQRADLDAQVALDSDPEISIYSDVNAIVRSAASNLRELRKKIKEEIAAGPPAPGGVWVIEWKERPGFLGLCGLQPFAMTASVTLYFRVIRSAWGQGIATEAARAVLAHGFASLNFPTITALVHPDNHRSRRVVEKTGMRYDGLVLIGPQTILNNRPAQAPAKFALSGLAAQPIYTNRYLCFRLNVTNYVEAMGNTQATAATLSHTDGSIK